MDGDAVDACSCRPRRGRYEETMGLCHAAEQLRKDCDDPRLPSATFATDELAELRSSGLLTTFLLQLTAYYSEGDALSSVEHERLGQLPRRTMWMGQTGCSPMDLHSGLETPILRP